MAQIFVSAGHGGTENGIVDPGIVLASTTEAAEMQLLRDLVVAELRSQGYVAVIVPDSLSAAQSINWINARCKTEDVALEIHGGFYQVPSIRGSAVFFIANNPTRQRQAELLSIRLRSKVPTLPSQGARPDTEFPTGSAVFCRTVSCSSLLMEVVVLSNPTDLSILQGQRRDIAQGIANGLISWSQSIATTPPPTEFPTINVEVNGRRIDEFGIVIRDNAYVPIDVADRLNIDLSQANNVLRVRYGNVVYVKAVDLRNYNVLVEWDATTRTVKLRSEFLPPGCTGSMDRIMGRGITSEDQLRAFMRSLNPDAADRFRDLPRLYREEAEQEGVNYDIAFSQMLVETNALAFGSGTNAAQNNFGGIGSANGSAAGASFPDARTGVRAHIQHLKAYASVDPLFNRVVDPRFNRVKRGIAPLVSQLNGRWSADPTHGDKIMGYLRRLYESIRA